MMCNTVLIFRRNGLVAECETRGQLHNALGIDPIQLPGHECEWRDDECLCPLDAEKTAEAAGMYAVPDPGWGWEFRERGVR